MISRTVRLGSPWAPGWKTAKPTLGQALITPATNWSQSVVDHAIGTGIGVVIGTTFGSITRLIIPSVRRQSKQTRNPFLIVGAAAAALATLLPFKGLLPEAVSTTGGISIGLGISGYLVGPKS